MRVWTGEPQEHKAGWAVLCVCIYLSVRERVMGDFPDFLKVLGSMGRSRAARLFPYDEYRLPLDGLGCDGETIHKPGHLLTCGSNDHPIGTELCSLFL